MDSIYFLLELQMLLCHLFIQVICFLTFIHDMLVLVMFLILIFSFWSQLEPWDSWKLVIFLIVAVVQINKICFLHFHKSVKYSITLLDIVYSNVWEPAHMPTNGGSRYYASFINDFTSYIWLYLMKRQVWLSFG